MKFMLMMNAPYDTGDYQIFRWTPEAFKAHVQFMKDLNRDLTKSGELVEVHALTPPGKAKIVRYRKASAPIISDGPFAESKEFLAGFWIVDVAPPGARMKSQRWPRPRRVLTACPWRCQSKFVR